MKILYFADTRFPIERANGVQTMATCRALAARGHEVTLVVRPDTAVPARDPFGLYGLDRPATLSIRTIGGARGESARRARFLLQAALAAFTARSVVFTRDLGLAALLVALPGRGRLVYESHGVADVVAAELPRLLGRVDLAPSPRKLARLARREARVWQRAAAYVTITGLLADELRGRFGDRPRVFVVPDGGPAPATTGPDATAASAAAVNGVGPDPADAAVPGATSGRVVVGYAGHLYPWKGVDVLVEALARRPDVDGLIVGGHPAERDRQRVEALVASHALGDRVALAGQVPPREVARRLAQASILVLPNTASAVSERYTSPLKLFEYLALGRPIVASDLPAIREVLTDEVDALLVPPGDPAALAAAIGRLAGDAGLAARLAAAARARAAAFTWDARAERLEAALEAAAA